MLKGEILTHKRNWNDAIAVFDKIITQEPKASQAHYYKGMGHLAKREVQVAKRSLNKAVELNPKTMAPRLCWRILL